MRPRVIFVSRERFTLPLDGTQKRKWDAVSAVVEPRVVAAAAPGCAGHDHRFRLAAAARLRILDGVLYYVSLPLRIGWELRSFRPEVVIAQGVHETTAALLARRLAGVRAKVVIDVQGDWREATRLYGSRFRRLLNPVNDVLGPFALHHADGVRTISVETTALARKHGREPLATFPPFVDFEVFRADTTAALPDVPSAVFVGSLERIKGFDVLAEAWTSVATRLPDARLTIVGTGTLAPRAAALVAGYPGAVEWHERRSSLEVARHIDDAWLLVLPSRSEGLGRVLLEAAHRGRALVGSHCGGIRDVVRPGENGFLVSPGDATELADTLVRVLSDRATAERLGAGARATGESWGATALEYAVRVESLVNGALGR